MTDDTQLNTRVPSWLYGVTIEICDDNDLQYCIPFKEWYENGKSFTPPTEPYEVNHD